MENKKQIAALKWAFFMVVLYALAATFAGLVSGCWHETTTPVKFDREPIAQVDEDDPIGCDPDLGPCPFGQCHVVCITLPGGVVRCQQYCDGSPQAGGVV